MAVIVSRKFVLPKRPDENTLLLLRGESLADDSQFGWPITNDGVSVSSEQSKFGGKSLYFDGTASLVIDANITFGSNDFTVDWWQYRQNNGTIAAFALLESGFCSLLMQHMDGEKLYSSYDSSGWNAVSDQNAFQNEKNMWVHWSIVRHGTTLTTYKNGVRYWSCLLVGTYTAGGKIYLGSHADPGNRDFYQGYIDEFRVSNVARWLSDYTPPTKQD